MTLAPPSVSIAARSSVLGEGRVRRKFPLRERIKVQSILEAAFFLPVLAYGQSIFFDFVYDDHTQISWNTWIRSFHNLPKFFTHSVWAFMNQVDAHSYYRPLQFVWYSVCYHFFGESPAGWHAASLLLHLTVVGTVFWSGMELLQSKLTAALGALLFAIHPTHCEAVVWVAGVPEPLCALFVAGSFASYLRAERSGSTRKVWQVISLLLGVAALLSKETAFCLPLLVFFHHLLLGTDVRKIASRLKEAFFVAVPYFAICLAVLVVQHFVLRGAHTTTLTELKQALLWVPGTVFFYARQLVLPVRLSHFYALPLSNAGGVGAFFGWLAVAAAMIGAGYFLLSRKMHMELFLTLWMGLSLLPALAATGTLGLEEAVHDRYLYLPSVAFCWILTRVLERGAESSSLVWSRLALAVSLFLCVTYAASSALETQPWRNDLILCEYAAKREPRNALALTSYGFNLEHEGRTNEATEALRKAIAVDPGFELPWLYLGSVQYHSGDIAGARESFKGAENLLRPDQKVARADLELQIGKVELRGGNLDAAADRFEKCLADDPGIAECRAQLTYVEGRIREHQSEKQ